jgi:hypothetical protein
VVSISDLRRKQAPNNKESERAMTIGSPRFQTGEYIILTQPCLGLPARSVGVITSLFSTDPPYYLIYFGESLPVGPFPERLLYHIRSTHRARREERLNYHPWPHIGRYLL